ncbi:MAG: hypothetical protein RMK20_12205 [Verrucomicrobiales bacterium]|nr:hypothetical protein [Verrucomicrobiales bacterium]
MIQFRAPDVRPAALGELVLRALGEYRSWLEGASGTVRAACALSAASGGGALITVETERLRARILPLSAD